MCDKCKNGLIPHPTIKNAWLDCECKRDEPLPYRPLSPADIDFPVSRDFYRFYASRNHWPDPGALKDEITVIDYQQVPPHALEQVKGQMLYIKGKIEEKSMKKNTSAF